MMLSPFTLTSRSPVGWEETQSPPTLQQVLGGDTWLSPHSRAGSRTLSRVTPMLLQASPHRGEDGKIGRECMKGTKTGPHLQGGGAGSGAAPQPQPSATSPCRSPVRSPAWCAGPSSFTFFTKMVSMGSRRLRGGPEPGGQAVSEPSARLGPASSRPGARGAMHAMCAPCVHQAQRCAHPMHTPHAHPMHTPHTLLCFCMPPKQPQLLPIHCKDRKHPSLHLPPPPPRFGLVLAGLQGGRSANVALLNSLGNSPPPTPSPGAPSTGSRHPTALPALQCLISPAAQRCVPTPSHSFPSLLAAAQ